MEKKKPLLICMTPIRNEAWVLHAFLKATSIWADHIIIADQMSTDGSREIALSYPKVILINNEDPKFNEAERQKMLIEKARQIEGDKILFALDADEIFTANFIDTVDWGRIINSKQGDVFWLQWAQVTEDKTKYYTSKHFPWVFHDDGIEPHGNYVANIHSMRIPYPIEEKQMYYINDFKVLHLSDLNSYRNRAKQRFYAFTDFLLNQRSVISLSRTYSRKKIKDKLMPLSDDMLKNSKSYTFNLFDFVDTNEENFWFNEKVLEYIQRNGIKYFRNLNVWDKEFLKRLNIKDPRTFGIKLIHYYLNRTQNFYTNFFIRVIDKLLKMVI